MSDFIFLNPSPNMVKLAENIRGRGYVVKMVRNDQIPEINANAVHMFYGGGFSSFYKSGQPLCGIKHFLKLNRGMLSGIGFQLIKSKLKKLSKDMSGGDAVDYCLIKRGMISEQHTDITSVSRASSFAEIAEDNSNAAIVTGFMEFVGGSEKLIMYDTDFDLKEALGTDYFVFFLPGTKVEMCRSGNRLVLVSGRKEDPLELLLTLMPFMKRFGFKKVKELIISRNRMPWIINNIDKGLVLMNDYSYFNVSIKLEPEWFEKVGRKICSGQRQ